MSESNTRAEAIQVMADAIYIAEPILNGDEAKSAALAALTALEAGRHS